VLQYNEYYPFGLAFNSYSRENATPNLYQYNGKEKQDELDLGWLDYGARMYEPTIGRWNGIDKRAHNYMSYSPYGYTVNNPVNYVDFNGEFILPKEFLNRFQRIAQYLAHDIQGILENKRVVGALKKHSGYSDKQLKKIFTWGQGPVLNPGNFAGDKFSELGKTLGLMDGNYNYIPGSAYITINEDLFEDLEVAKGKDRDYLLFVTAVTILHELVHYGYLENNLKTQTDEEGNDFEKDAYGKVIRMSTGTHKEVFNNWQKRNGPGNGGSSGSIDLYFYNSSGSTNSGGGSSNKKKKKPDADREASKRSGGGY
jgi:RHS repeat-associated protein